MRQSHIFRFKHGNTTMRDYVLPIPNVRITDRAYVPNSEHGIYRGDMRRLTPSSRTQLRKLETAVKSMKHVGVCFMDILPKRSRLIPRNQRVLAIKLSLDPRFTDNESRWIEIEKALTSSFGLPIVDTKRLASRRNIKISKRRRNKRSAA